MRSTRTAPALLTALGLALPGLAVAAPGAEPRPAPVAKIACTIDSTDGTTRQTVSRPRIATRVGRPAQVSLRAETSAAHPAHTLVLALETSSAAVKGEARIEIDGQKPIVRAIHLQNDGQWVTLNVAGSFSYVIDCSIEVHDGNPPAPPEGSEPSPPPTTGTTAP